MRLSMTRCLHEPGHVRAVMAVVVALALSVRLLIPTGYIPTQVSHELVVTVCDAMGGKTMVLEIPRSEEDKKPGHPEQPQPCAFASMASPAIHSNAGIALPHVAGLIHEIALPPPAAVSIPRGTFLLPPLRGPPALA